MLQSAIPMQLPAWVANGPQTAILHGNELVKAEPGIFNEESLLRRMMGDRKLAGIVVRGFIEEIPTQLNILRARLAQADAPGAQMQAHALKGSAATAAAEGLSAAALAVERAGAEGQLDHCGELLPGVVEEFERFKITLKRAGWL